MFELNKGLWYYIIVEVNGNKTEPWLYILLTVGFAVAASLIAYLLGSINSAIIVSRVFYRDDIRRHGSGNAGLTNVLRTYGKKAALFTLLGDMLKTVIAIVIACLLGGFGYIRGISVGGATCDIPLGYLAGLFVVLGHIFPVYYNFKGGKGVLCTATMALLLTPIEFLILMAVFVLMVATSKYVSLGSVTAGVLYPVAVAGHITVLSKYDIALNGIMALVTIILAILIVYCHRENLKRISQGNERKLSFGGKKDGGNQ